MRNLKSTDAGQIYGLCQQMSNAERRRQARQLTDQADKLDLHPRKQFQARVNRLRMMVDVLLENLT